MDDEKSQRESGIPVEEGSLFDRAAKEAARRKKEENERKNAGRVVIQWLERFKKKEEIKAKVPLEKMAEEVLEGLTEGRIFFAVRSPEQMEIPLRARKVNVRFPLRKIPDPSYPNQLIEATPWGTIVVLEVKRGVEPSELLTPQVEEQLRRLYWYDQNVTLEDEGRIKIGDPVNIKNPDIGPFPKLD